MWLQVGPTADIARRKRVVVDNGDTPIVVIAHEGNFYALDNICIHKQRELVKGVVLKDRIVCPGHQWSFELGTGWEAKMGRCQPIYDVKVEDGMVLVDAASRRAQQPVAAESVVMPVDDGGGAIA
ncbi:MAG TPA: Rieske 2Fe-2S domain-containing protein [Acidimicrobiales bacterium]|jgi:nitrite reductase (NADH) small subunit|nr:Rieske 2Fe-2S domain-containing protein [Acidimicrobiales bacterium]